MSTNPSYDPVPSTRQPDTLIVPSPVVSPPAVAALPGYELLEELGRGGMGVVYKARDRALKRLVAVKMIRAGAVDAPQRQRFRVEAEATARLQHPNIVQIHEVGEANGQPYLVMEFCEGGSLAARIASSPLTPREGAQLVETLARAVHSAHQQNVLHRDLKPSNVLLAGGGDSGAGGPDDTLVGCSSLNEVVPKVADFGLARLMDEESRTHSGEVLGTPGYMPPEQARGDHSSVGPPADVYSLGAILYHCLAGRPPFRAGSSQATIQQVITEEPIALSRLDPGCPRDLETICQKCLRKEPGRRYDSALALADDLQRYLAAEPIRARRVRRLERLALWARRRPLVAGLLLTTVLSLLLGVTASVWFGVTAEQQRQVAEERARLIEIEQDNTRQALRQTESALAEGLLRPLGRSTGPLEPAEVDALERLARLPRAEVGQEFLRQALTDADAADRLRHRLEPALVAVVGLDLERRRQAADRVVTCFGLARNNPRIRAVCAEAGGMLRATDAAFARDASLILFADIALATGPIPFQRLTEALVPLLEQVDDADNMIVDARTSIYRLQADSWRLLKRAECDRLFLQVAGKLTSRGATRLGQEAAERLERDPSRSFELHDDVLLKAALDRMAKVETSGLADRVAIRCIALQTAGDTERRKAFDYLLAVAPHLSSAQAQRAARVLADVSGRVSGVDVLSCSRALGALTQRLSDAEAAPLTRGLGRRISALAESCERTADMNLLSAALDALAPSMTVADRQQVAQTLTLRMIEMIVAPPTKDALPHVANPPFSWLDRDGIEVVVRRLEEAAGGVKLHDGLLRLRVLSSALLPRLSPAQTRRVAASISGQALELGAEFAVTKGPRASRILHRALVHHLDAEDAAALARRAAGKLATPLPLYGVDDCSEALQALLARAPPEPARTIAEEATGHLFAQLKRERVGLNLLSPVPAALGRVAPVSHGEAVAFASRTVEQVLVDLETPGTEQRTTFSQQREAVTQLARLLPRTEARAGAVRLSAVAQRYEGRPGLAEFVDCFRALAARLDNGDVSSLAAPFIRIALSELRAPPPNPVQNRPLLVRQVADLLSPADCTRAVTLLLHLPEATRVEPGPEWLSTLTSVTGRMELPELIEVLKSPVCIGPARVAVLQRIGTLAKRSFANTWEAVDWLREHRQAIDLRTPFHSR